MMTSRRSRSLAASFLLLPLLLSACAVTDKIGETVGVCMDSYCRSLEAGRYIDLLEFDAGDYEPEPEKQVANMKLVRAANKGLFVHDPLQGYVQGVLDRIVAHGPPVSSTPKAVIAANASMNALSMPGGLIVIHHSFANYLKNEEQLAFILAHEYAHYLLDHFSSFDEVRAYVLTGVETIVALQSNGDEDDRRAMLKVYGSDILVRDMLNAPWSRRKEDEADRLGVDLMAKAGYNPLGAEEYLRILANYEEQAGRDAEIQLNKLEEFLDEKYGGEEDGSLIDPETGRIDITRPLLVKGFGAFKDMQKDFAAKHDAAIERAAAVALYIERDYEEEFFRDRPTTEWSQVMSRSKSLLNNYDTAFNLVSEIESEDLSAKELASLETQARAAVSGTTEADSYTRFAFYLLRRQQNKLGLAERNLDIALEKDEVSSFQILQAKADILEMKGQNAAAFDLLDQNAEEFSWPLSAYLSMIRLAPKAGKEDRRLGLVTNCMFKYPQSQQTCRSVQ